MPFQRKLLPGRVVVDNSYYHEEYERALGQLNNVALHDLRAGLARIQQDWRLQGTRGSMLEAIVTKMICKGDCPKLIDSTGYRWA